jgi:hypothetical protein
VKKKKSDMSSSFLHFLVGIEKVGNITDIPEGVKIEGNHLSLRFSKTVSDLPGQLTSAIYGIVSPENYSVLNGEWKKESLKVVTSTQYTIESQSINGLTLLNKGEGKYRHIQFVYNSDENFDLYFGPSYLNYKEKNFLSNPVLSLPTYMRVMSWKNMNSFFSHLDARESVKKLFYKKIKGSTFFEKKWQLGFIQDVDLKEEVSPAKEITVKAQEAVKIYIENKTDSDFKKELEKVIVSTFQELSIPFVFVEMSRADFLVETKTQGTSQKIDLAFNQLYLERDILSLSLRFAFGSNVGACLPDIGGVKEVIGNSGSSVDYQKINAEIERQSLIWMIGHYGAGVYFSEKINAEKMSLSSPVVDLQVIQKEE